MTQNSLPPGSRAWLAIPPEPGDMDWWRWYNAPGRRIATLRP